MTDFGGDNNHSNVILLDSLDRILTIGHATTGSGAAQDFSLIRYSPAGSLDTTFDGDGKVSTNFDDIDIGSGSDWADGGSY